MGLYLAPAHFIIIFIRRVRGVGVRWLGGWRLQMQRGLRDKLRRIRILHCISDSEKLRAVVIVLWRSKDLFSIVAALPTARTVATR